jgi:hypothetical protein
MFAVAVLHLICLKQQAPDLVGQVAASGRCVTLAETPDAKTKDVMGIAPGQPPVLTFRYYEGKLHHRFGNSDLMLDDAGH